MRGGVLWALPCPSCAPGPGWNWAVLRLRSLLADCGFAPSRGRGLGRCGSIARVVRGRPPRPRHRAYLLVGCVALASFTLALGLARAVPRPLPTGSDLERFDRAVWQDPRSADYVPGDVTPRQKMLADVVKSVLPC